MRKAKFNHFYFNVYLWTQQTITPVTVQMCCERFNVPPARARRALNFYTKPNYLKRRSVSEWNGMYYRDKHYWW